MTRSRLLILALVIPMLMANQGGCSERSDSNKQAAVAVEQNQQRLINATPAPQLSTSLERRNLAKRLARVNAQNMSGFIYLISQGQVMASYPINGKISSLNSYLAPEGKLVFGYEGASGEEEMPDFDGAYGKNDDGIFFFTADTDALVEWHGDYLFSDQPLKLNQQPAMLRMINEK